MKNYKTIVKRLIAMTLSLVMLLALAACGSQPAQTPETAAPTQEAQPEMNRDELPSETLQGVYHELVADYSGYSQTKRYYDENMPDVKFTEELGEDQFTITVDSTSEYVESGSWTFADEGSALTTTVAGDDFAGMMLVQDVVEAVAFYYGMVPGLAQSYVNGLWSLGINNDNFSMTENPDGTIIFRVGTAGEWDMKELDQMVLSDKVLEVEPLDEEYVSHFGSVGKVRMYSEGNVDSFTMLVYEYEDLDDVAYQSIMNVVKLRQPKGWERFVANYTRLESVETDEYTVTIDPDEDTIFELLDEIDGLWSYVLVQFGESQSGDGYGCDSEREVADSFLSGTWQDKVSQRASLDVVMYTDGSYDMTVWWGDSATETAVWEITGYFQDGAVLPYEDGYYTVRSYDENGNETITQEAVTNGSFTWQEDGKLRWHDSQVEENGYSEDCLFVQMG